MNWLQPLITALIVAVAIVASIYHFQRSASILQTWARRNGYRILSKQPCWFWRGPFFLSSSKDQEVYRVSVRDRTGQIRTGYVRCGGIFLGMFSDRADVIWDRKPAYRPGFPVVFHNSNDDGPTQ